MNPNTGSVASAIYYGHQALQALACIEPVEGEIGDLLTNARVEISDLMRASLETLQKIMVLSTAVPLPEELLDPAESPKRKAPVKRSRAKPKPSEDASVPNFAS